MSTTTERFELQTRIAVGNAGLVYRGIDKATRRRVALKLLSEELAHPLDGPALVRDAARVRRTAGNNIAQLLEVIDDEAGVVLVAEYADGQSWAEAATERRLDAAQAVDVAAQLLSALAVGEAIRVPHGELKPANLVLGELPGGRLFVWVLDWGLAAYRPEPPPDALPWMAPEQLAGGPASAAGDLFSMGACLCWLLTGTVPVAGQTRAELLAAWKQFPADALRQVRPDLPPKFTKWVSGLMEVNPKARFANVQQARGALVPLQPPSPPILPEIFRPRPKAPGSTVIAPPRSTIQPAPRAVAAPRVVAVPRVVARAVEPPPEAPAPECPPDPAPSFVEAELEIVEASAAPEIELLPAVSSPDAVRRKRAWLWAGAATLGLLGALGATWFFLHRPPAPQLATAPESPTVEPVAAKSAAPLPTIGLIATDRFAYPPGTLLDQQKAGTGWMGAWSAPGVMVRAGSIVGGQPALGGKSGHAEIIADGEITLRRSLAPRAAVIDEETGGTWWFSFVVAHSSPAGVAKGGELHCNLFNDSRPNEIIRLAFVETGPGLTVTTYPELRKAALPGAANLPKRVLVRLKASPVGPRKFDVTLDLWANPVLAAFATQPPKPALSTTVRQTVLPAQLGFMLQKKKAAVTTTTLLDAISFGRTAPDVIK